LESEKLEDESLESRRALGTGSVDHEESIRQDLSVIKVEEPSQPAAREHQVNNNKSSRRKQRLGMSTSSKIS